MEAGWGEIKADRCRRVIHATPAVGLDFREAGSEIRVHHWRLDEAEPRLRASGIGREIRAPEETRVCADSAALCRAAGGAERAGAGLCERFWVGPGF